MRTWTKGGKRLVLNVRPSLKASVVIYNAENTPVFYRQYEWWETTRAEAEAEAIAEFAGAKEQLHGVRNRTRSTRKPRSGPRAVRPPEQQLLPTISA